MRIPTKYLARFIVVLLAIASVVGLFVGVELACRLVFPRIDPRVVFVADPGPVAPDNPTVFDYKRFWKLRPGMKDRRFQGTMLTTNSLGVRWDSEFEKKDAVTIRIVPMGDSVTYGWGVPQEPEKNSGNYSFHLQRILRERHPDWKWEVIPLACPGYTTAQGRFWLEEAIDKIQPDLIIPCFAWNDASDSLRTNNQIGMYSKSAQRIRWLADQSQLVTRILKWRSGTGAKLYSDVTRESPEWLRLPRATLEDFILDHQSMWQLAKAHGAETAVILPMITVLDEQRPLTNECLTLFRNKLTEFCKGREIPALLIPELTEKSAPGNFALFRPDKIHPNADGHKLIGERLYPFLIPSIDRITAARREANARK